MSSRVMRVNEMTSDSSSGAAPPLRPLAAPRPTIGTPAAFAALTAVTTSWVLSASTTHSGVLPTRMAS